jgi:aspartate racemase
MDMRTIGLIGGLSWQSTQTYYQIINSEVNERLGKNHSASILMYSFDFDEIESLQYNSDWNTLNELMTDAGQRLSNAGADCLLICSNTMHECASYIEKQIDIPLIHVADTVGYFLVKGNFKRAALLGTKFLMNSDTYTDRLKNKYGIETIMPDGENIEVINKIIYKELVKGTIVDHSRDRMLSIIQDLKLKGAEAVILGCTEIPMLIKQDHCDIPVIDTTDIHARSAVKYVLGT